jgi:hypothetical protein
MGVFDVFKPKAQKATEKVQQIQAAAASYNPNAPRFVYKGVYRYYYVEDSALDPTTGKRVVTSAKLVTDMGRFGMSSSQLKIATFEYALEAAKKLDEQFRLAKAQAQAAAKQQANQALGMFGGGKLF